MTRLPVRLTLLFACVAAIGAAAFLTWSSDERVRLTDNSSRQFDATARAVSLDVAELRAAQQAYVAEGQGVDFWFARVSAIVKDVNDKLSSLKPLASSPEALTAVDEAAGALQDFEQMDKRARDYARGRQLTLASDLVFTDGLDLTKKAGDAVERGMTAERTARDADVGGLRRKEALTLGGAAGVATLGLLLLVPIGRRRPDAESAAVPIAALVPPVSPETLDDLRDFGVATVPVPDAPEAAGRRVVDMVGMAGLCGDLARIQDTQALPALLGRAAEVLQASGIVLWIADPDGRELSPIVVHGYPAHLASRFGTIARNAANVTASAYRTGLLQTMKGDAISNGAVAAPLVTAAGCVGVMAAELKDGGELQESRLAAATIIASQLATLVGPPSTRAKTEAAG
ncbi:MAG TPA: GAF domain-containing protein [Vicinamibacterales bacterium]